MQEFCRFILGLNIGKCTEKAGLGRRQFETKSTVTPLYFEPNVLLEINTHRIYFIARAKRFADFFSF